MLAGLAFLLTIALVFTNYKACAVMVDGKTVALATNKKEASRVIEQLQEQSSNNTGQPLELTPGLTLKTVWVSKREALAGESLQELLADAPIYQSNGVGISVDGNVIATVEDEAAARQVLVALQERFGVSNEMEVSFAEKVELVDVQVPRSRLLGLNTALEYICTGGEEVQTYALREGDNLWDVALRIGTTMEELEAANPEVRHDRLQIGQVINLRTYSPLITVIASCETTVKEEIPYRVQEKQDSSLYVGERKVVQPGQTGEKEVEYRLVYRNGVEADRKVIAERVLQEPEPRVVAKGSRMLVASRSGSSSLLSWPAGGGIASAYGMRSGRMHTGIDIAANHGAPVVAGEAGRVTSAAYQGGYGLMVQIDHGGGVVTRYAHLSSAAVKSGQQVERGQLIGRVGSTGNSTGPHLHFEVLFNGQHKNPVNYL